MEGLKKLSLKEYAHAVKEAAGMVCELEDVHMQEVVKNNGKRCMAITFLQKGENVSPVMYLDEFYQEYLKHGFVESLNILMEVYQENRCRDYMDFAFLNVYSEVRKHLFPRLVSYERNTELLQDMLHERFLDLAVMFQYVFEKNGRNCSILIKNEYLEAWGITEQEVYADALYHLGQHVYRNLLFDEITMLSENMERHLEKDEMADGIHGMQVLSNNYRFYGASAMLDRNALDETAEEMECDRVFILPSSVHEVLLLGGNKGMGEEELRLLVKDVNQSGVIRTEDFLSDSVYMYERSTGEVRIA